MVSVAEGLFTYTFYLKIMGSDILQIFAPPAGRRSNLFFVKEKPSLSRGRLGVWCREAAFTQRLADTVRSAT